MEQPQLTPVTSGTPYKNPQTFQCPEFRLIPINDDSRKALQLPQNKHRLIQLEGGDSAFCLAFDDPRRNEFGIGGNIESLGDGLFLPDKSIDASFRIVRETGAVLLCDHSENGTARTTVSYTATDPALGLSNHVNIDDTTKSILLARGINPFLSLGEDVDFQFRVHWICDGMSAFFNSEVPYTLGPRKSEVKRYVKGKRIGSGRSSTVFSALDITTGTLLAVKVFHYQSLSLTRRSALPKFISTFQSSIRHDHILQIIGSAGARPDLSWAEIFLPLKPGNLATLAQGSTEDECGEIAETMLQQMLSALDCLTRNGFIHRDLKPENILWDEASKSPTKYNFWLTDIGQGISASGGRTDVSVAAWEPFSAPEVYHGPEWVTKKADIWSLFATYAWVRNPEHFRGDCQRMSSPEIHRRIHKLSRRGEFSRIRRMAELDPNRRPSSRELLDLLNAGDVGSFTDLENEGLQLYSGDDIEMRYGSLPLKLPWYESLAEGDGENLWLGNESNHISDDGIPPYEPYSSPILSPYQMPETIPLSQYTGQDTLYRVPDTGK
ncbi:hypothetical protein QBC47DRAFT_432735, partial [Echria macrotheca]